VQKAERCSNFAWPQWQWSWVGAVAVLVSGASVDARSLAMQDRLFDWVCPLQDNLPCLPAATAVDLTATLDFAIRAN
jgi:hypothetical protein